MDKLQEGDILICDMFNLIQSHLDMAIFLLKQLDWNDSDLEKVMASIRESDDVLSNK